MRTLTLTLILMLLLTSTSWAQVPQPDLDLPVAVDNYRPGAPGVVPPDEEDDVRDEPAPVFFGEEIESGNETLVYVIDCSCSMSQEDRMLRAKRELERSIKSLPPNFKFNIISYACSIEVLWPELAPATEANKSAARQYIGTLGPHSGTATGPATARALFDKQVKCVVLLTDGAPNCGAQGVSGHRSMINNTNSQRAVINVFGIDAFGDYRVFCQDVAKDSGGSYVDIP